MQRHFINDHSLISSPVHALDPRTKIVLTLGFILALTTAAPHALMTYVFLGGILVWTVALARIPLGLLLRRAAVVLPFTALMALGLPFMADGPRLQAGRFSLSEHGLWLLASATAKAFLSVAALLVCIATTATPDLLAGMRALRFSPLLLDIAAMTLRYMAVLAQEAHRLRTAASARGFRPFWLTHAKTVGQWIGALFVRCYERAERIHEAARLRGYDFHMPTAELAPLPWREKCVLLGSFLLIAAARFCAG